MWDELWQLNLVILTTFKWKQTFWNIILLKSENWNIGCVNKMFTSNAWKKSESWNIENKSLTLNASKKSENWNIEIRLRPCSNFLPCVCLPLLAYRITGQETFRPAEKQNAKKLPKHWKKTKARSAMQCFWAELQSNGHSNQIYWLQ